MFKNVGKKIKIASVVITVISLIGALVGAISVWSMSSGVFNGGFAKFLVGLGVLAGGAVVAVFMGLLCQGYGIIVESHENKKQ